MEGSTRGRRETTHSGVCVSFLQQRICNEERGALACRRREESAGRDGNGPERENIMQGAFHMLAGFMWWVVLALVAGIAVGWFACRGEH